MTEDVDFSDLYAERRAQRERPADPRPEPQMRGSILRSMATDDILREAPITPPKGGAVIDEEEEESGSDTEPPTSPAEVKATGNVAEKCELMGKQRAALPPWRRPASAPASAPPSGSASGSGFPRMANLASPPPDSKYVAIDPGQAYTHASSDELPPEYVLFASEVVDWNDPATIDEEERIAQDFGMPLKVRGPPSPKCGGPVRWHGMPWNETKECWAYSSRADLTEEYTAITDWWSDESMDLETVLQKKCLVPWELRGPPDGPTAEHQTWRGRTWRRNS